MNHYKKLMRSVTLLAVLLITSLTAGAQVSEAQVSEGLYYLGSHGYYTATTANKFYLCPTEPTDPWIWYYTSTSPYYTSTNNEQPFMTTYKCLDGTYDSKKALWVIKDAGDGYFHIIHVVDGKFLTYNTAMGNNSNKGRMRVHLQSTADGDNALFQITYVAQNAYDITTKNGGPDNASRKYLNVTGNAGAGNQNSLIAANTKKDGPNSINVGGIIGLWTSGCAGDTNSKWYPESVLLTAPTISDVSPSNTITITDVNSLPTGYTIRYTTDGTDPTATTGTVYSGPIDVEDSWTVKAVVVQYGVLLTSVSSKAVTPVIAAPTVTNNFDGTISLSTTTLGTTIYYTTDGTTPSSSSNEYSSPFSLGNASVIKAIAYLGSEYSEVTTYNVPQYDAPTLSLNGSTSMVTITTDGTAAYYTTDGSTPTTSSTAYSAPFSVSIGTTVKAIATNTGYLASTPASLAITQVATPTIQNNGSNAVSITSATPDATIYYTLDGSTPTTSSNEYTEPLTENVSGVTIKAIAVKENMVNSAVGSGAVMLQCATPVIRHSGDSFTITCAFPSSGVTIYYTYVEGDGIPADPTTSSSHIVSGGSVTPASFPVVVKAMAVATNYNNSAIATSRLIEGMSGSGTPADPYLIASQEAVNIFVEMANSVEDAGSCYKVTAETLDFSAAAAITRAFTGTFDGNGRTLTGLTHALFNTVDGGTVKNVMLDDVAISSGTNVGAICNEATGDSRIYNCGVLATGSTATTDEDGYTTISSCSSTISGSGYVGGIVGLLDDEARVINCFSYADITGGDRVGGIVGYNNVATTSSNLKTMVMNCMFYGDITDGTNKAPIYNGEIITNDGDASGVNNFNYFRAEATYVQGRDIQTYHCALAAETRFLQRFEFFRHILNANRALAAWWITGDRADTAEVMKWVMEPSQIGTSTPYPILKKWGKYSSVVNYTPSTTAYDEAHRNQGRKLTSEGDNGVLHVTIQMGDGDVFDRPYKGTGDAATITTPSLDLTITDKDTAHFNFNYGKVQLPYYNDVGTKNYNGYRVVTGWKIVSIKKGNAEYSGRNSYSTGADVTFTDGELTATPYNFADRYCTDKDLYSESRRVFNQGAYWDVPVGVTAITIEPYWAKAVYLSDASADVVYMNSGSDAMVTPVDFATVGGGTIFANDNYYTIAGESQKVYTSIGNAIATAALYESVDEATYSARKVYDYAVVLVGNYHHTDDIAAGGKPYTITSIDLDGDNEPDYSLMLRFNSRKTIHPVRFDFLNLIGLGMAQKTTGGTGTYNLGIMQPKYWFEVTNTALFRVTQFEYDQTSRAEAPYILHGGVIEQWVLGQNNGASNNTTYFHVGGNVWFKEFHRGTHQDQDLAAKHPPVSVTGGDFDQFHLTGLYRADVNNFNDNAECYINGGRFGVVAGTGMDGIGDTTNHTNGNITWVIDNADINEFYAGSFNAAQPAQGSLNTTIRNSYVTFFVGGPKFGDLNSGRTVITNADNCHFVLFFGAGYGGNSYSRQAPYNANNKTNIDWNKWIRGETYYGDAGKNPDFNGYQREYKSRFDGISTQINYQFIPMSGNLDNCARLWIEYVKFSLATTHNVTSYLKHCTIDSNFYGGGSLGKVDGNVKSTLDSCIVKGNVFGAGYSATRPPVPVMNRGGFKTPPEYDNNLGAYLDPVFPDTVHYRWDYNASFPSGSTIDTINHIIYTNEDLNALGTVQGNDTVILSGSTIVGTTLPNGTLKPNTGNVFGGGDMSGVTQQKDGEDNPVPGTGNTAVILRGTANVLGDVYGGGNRGAVGGKSSVTIE